MTTAITITGPMTVPHENANAAGFKKGYRWQVDVSDHPELNTLESYAPTRKEAERQAIAQARARQIFDAEVES